MSDIELTDIVFEEIPTQKRRSSGPCSNGKKRKMDTVTAIDLLLQFWKRPIAVGELQTLINLVDSVMEDTTSIILQKASALWAATRRLMRACMLPDMVDGQLSEGQLPKATISPPKGELYLPLDPACIFTVTYPVEQGRALLDVLLERERTAILTNSVSQAEPLNDDPFTLDAVEAPAGVINYATLSEESQTITIKSPPQLGQMCFDLKVYPMAAIVDLDTKDYWRHVKWSGRVVTQGSSDPLELVMNRTICAMRQHIQGLHGCIRFKKDKTKNTW